MLEFFNYFSGKLKDNNGKIGIVKIEIEEVENTDIRIKGISDYD